MADGLQNAYELVKFIREEHGDFFCVAVAGYPEAHIECWNSPTLPPSEQVRCPPTLASKQALALPSLAPPPQNHKHRHSARPPPLAPPAEAHDGCELEGLVIGG